MGISLIMPFLHGPLLFYYIVTLTKPQDLNLKLFLTHAALPVFILILDLPFFMLESEAKIFVFKNSGKGFENAVLISQILLSISGLIYLFLNFKLLNEHKKRVLAQFSNQENINLNWLRILIYMMAVIWIFIIFSESDPWIFSLSSIYVVVLGYFGINQVGIFTNNSVALESVNNSEVIEDIEPTEEKKKYAKSGLTEDAAFSLHENLKSLMQEKQLFQEAELTLVELSNYLNVHPNYLSQVINEKEEVNFYDYINGLRVEEFKRLLLLPENQKYTIIALAYECGFNSKSAFNRIFKKHTNLSPTEYMKEQGIKNIKDL
ncbi:MAG: AraC family transcriptional regulator [Saprospiraceae bacterium]|nr:AraC family transcriptional regulator [Saprospiraceae bacterium]